MIDEEIEEVEESEEETVELEETDNKTKKEKKETIKLDWSMDVLERLQIEINQSKTDLERQLGIYMLEQFKTDTALKNAYFDRKVSLSNVAEFVTNQAKKKLNGKSGYVAPEEVYGWVIHYVQDEKVPEPKSESLVLTKQEKEDAKQRALEQFEKEELEKLRKKQEKEEARFKKKQENKLKVSDEYEQLTMFDI